MRKRERKYRYGDLPEAAAGIAATVLARLIDLTTINLASVVPGLGPGAR